MLERASALLGHEPQIRVMGPVVMRLGGIFIPEKAFGLAAAPVDEGLCRTLEWYRARHERQVGAV